MRSECCSGPVNLHQQPGIAEWCPPRQDCMSTTRSAYVVPADGVQPPVSHHLITRATHGTMAGDPCDTHRDWGAARRASLWFGMEMLSYTSHTSDDAMPSLRRHASADAT